MPLAMIHLGVANYLASRNDWIDSGTLPQFFLGSISPDCVGLRQEIRQRDRARSHLWLESQSSRMPKSLVFWQNRVIEFLRRNGGEECSAFPFGYCIHVLTDLYWYETVFETFRIRYRQDGAPVLEEKHAFTNDIEQLEQILLKQSEWAGYSLDLLRASEGESLREIVSAQEVDEWKRLTLLWLESGGADFQSPVRYLTQSDIEQFIEDAGDYVEQCLSRSSGGRNQRVSIGK